MTNWSSIIERYPAAQHYGSSNKSGGAVVLSIDFRKSVEEEANVSHTPELCPECFDLCIERFSCSIGASSIKEI